MHEPYENLQEDHKAGLHLWPHEDCYTCQQKRTREKIDALKAELKASLDHEKTVKIAPATGSWDHWPQGWMDRRNYVVGLRHRRWARTQLRRKIARLQAQLT